MKIRKWAVIFSSVCAIASMQLTVNAEADRQIRQQVKRRISHAPFVHQAEKHQQRRDQRHALRQHLTRPMRHAAAREHG